MFFSSPTLIQPSPFRARNYKSLNSNKIYLYILDVLFERCFILCGNVSGNHGNIASPSRCRPKIVRSLIPSAELSDKSFSAHSFQIRTAQLVLCLVPTGICSIRLFSISASETVMTLFVFTMSLLGNSNQMVCYLATPTLLTHRKYRGISLNFHLIPFA